MKHKRKPILPVKATYIGEVSTPAELVAALKAAAVCRGQVRPGAAREGRG